jgi:hypothetical protein
LIAEGQRQRDGQELEEKMQVLERLIAAVTAQLQLLSSQVREGAEGGLPRGEQPFFWETTTAGGNVQEKE